MNILFYMHVQHRYDSGCGAVCLGFYCCASARGQKDFRHAIQMRMPAAAFQAEANSSFVGVRPAPWLT